MSTTHTTVECRTAAEFLDALSPRSQHFAQHEPRTWVFRGQERNSWPLVPTALRQNERERVNSLAGPVDPAYGGQFVRQAAKEKQIATKFFDAVDDAGLLPVLNWEMVRHYLFEQPPGQFGLPTVLWPIFALAQHYGLPTRLLDWSRAPRYAAYFAARNAAQDDPTATTGRSAPASAGPRNPDDERLVVWALHGAKIDALARIPGISTQGQFHYVGFVTAPRAGNPNLHAQEGIFTLHVSSDRDDVTPDGMPLDEVLVRVSERLGDRWVWTQSDLLRFTLPRTESRQLMKLLAAEGVTAAKLFPGFGGAAQTVLDQRYWPRD